MAGSPPPPSPPPPKTSNPQPPQSHSVIQPQSPPPSPPSQTPSFGLFSFQNRRSPVRVTSEFDSDSSIFFHKVSSKVFNGVAKLKLCFHNTAKGEIVEPQVAFITKNLAIHYDIEEQNAFVKGFIDFGPNLKLKAAHDVKAREGEVTMAANLSDPGYQFELTSTVPSISLPKATLIFPNGQVSLEEKKDDEVKRILSINGMVKGSIFNGVCTALYKDENLNLSYWYNFDTNYWSTVYKHTIGKDYMFKVGYDSEVGLGWTSLWVGDENGKTKTAPNKMKVQFMLQVPQADIKSSVLMFRVKKRWDI